MRTLILTTLAVAGFAAVTAASAAPQDMNDTTYIAVARCAGVAEGLGSDAKPFTSVLDAQSVTRMPDVQAMADDARAQGKRAAVHAGQDGRGVYERELSGTCKTYTAAG